MINSDCVDETLKAFIRSTYKIYNTVINYNTSLAAPCCHDKNSQIDFVLFLIEAYSQNHLREDELMVIWLIGKFKHS